jgi:hypothetical protein
MFTLITVTAVPGFFSHAGETREGRFYKEATAAEVLRVARERADSRLYKAVGIRVGHRRKSPVMWIK